MTGFEPLIGIGTAALTGLVTEIVKTRGSKLADQLDRDLLKPRLQQAIRNYIQNYEKRHGELKVGLEALKGKKGEFQHDCIPVFLALQQFKSQEIKIEQAIAKEFEVCDFPEAADFAEAALEKGKLLVLLDGLDEVPLEHLDHAITQIQDLVDRYGQNQFIASCRVAAYRGGFPRFKDVAMVAFTDHGLKSPIYGGLGGLNQP